MEVFSSKFPLRNNKYLMNIVFSYLNLIDSLSTSQVDKNWHNITEEHFNSQWKTQCNKHFALNSQQQQQQQHSQLTLASDWYASFQINDLSQSKDDEVMKPYYKENFSWKKLYVLGMKIKGKWTEYIGRCAAGPIKDDFQALRDEIYSDLKECLLNPKLRKDNILLENNLNTEFQYSLYDYYEEEEELYIRYNDLMGKKATDANEDLVNYPFGLLIEYCTLFVQNLQKNAKQLDKFTELRWYLFEPNYDAEKIQKELNGCVTDNVIIFALKIIIMTLKHHCFLSFNYLNSTEMTGEELLNEYSVRYQNFIQTALEINEKYRHLSIIVNFIYEKTKSINNEPKFSLLRLFMIMWNNCCLAKLKVKLTQALSECFTGIVEKDLDSLLNNHPEDNSFNSMRTACSSKDSIPSTSMCYYNVTTYCYKGQSNSLNETQKTILSRIVSQLNDSFCNEYSVFNINLTTLETNDIYATIESNIIQSLQKAIVDFYNSRLLNKIQPIVIANELFNYFKESDFYQNYFINKLQLKINETIYQTLEAILARDVNSLFQNHFLQSIQSKVSLQIAEVFLEHYQNEYKGDVLYRKLQKKMNANGNCNGNDKANANDKLKEYVLILFFQYYSKLNGNMYSLSKEITNWFNDKENEKLKTNKKVTKQIRNKNMKCNRSYVANKILSFAWQPCREDIIAYEEECKQRMNAINSDSMMID